jgi:hypothetical protein
MDDRHQLFRAQFAGSVQATFKFGDALCIDVETDNLELAGEERRQGQTDIAETDDGDRFFTRGKVGKRRPFDKMTTQLSARRCMLRDGCF